MISAKFLTALYRKRLNPGNGIQPDCFTAAKKF